MDLDDNEDYAYIKEEEVDGQSSSSKPVRRRARLALSCQRCRKNRSKCSRTRPRCTQCEEADVECTYLEIPGDLESTALRQRFAGLEDQIHTALAQFDIVESLVKDNLDNLNHQKASNNTQLMNRPDSAIPIHLDQHPENLNINTGSIQSWNIKEDHDSTAGGLSIHTNSRNLDDIYQVLLNFGLDNMHLTEQDDADSGYEQKNLVRNDVIYRSMRLSHFTTVSLKHIPNDQPLVPQLDSADSDNPIPVPMIPPTTLIALLRQHHSCILHGSIPKFARTFSKILLQSPQPQQLRMLQSSMLCHLIPHAYRWHPHILMPFISSEQQAFTYAQQYYACTRQILAACCFEEPTLLTVHTLVNLALYNIESGDPDITYMNIGMASRMVYSLGMHREENLTGLVESQLEATPVLRSIFENRNDTVHALKEYARSLFWVVYCVDTDASHFHNKPYNMNLDTCTIKFHAQSSEVIQKTRSQPKRDKSTSPATQTLDLFPPLSQELEESEPENITMASGEEEEQQQQQPTGSCLFHTNNDQYQALYKLYNFQNLQITREIRQTCYSDSQNMVRVKEVERIEGILRSFYDNLPEWIRNENEENKNMTLWQSRCKYMELIRYYGNWILLHQTYLPLPELESSPGPTPSIFIDNMPNSPPSRFPANEPLDAEHNHSLAACTKAAMRIACLFDMWVPSSSELVALNVDCYFRPCVHEFKHACEVLVYNANHAQTQDIRDQSLHWLKQLLTVMHRTPVWDIAKERPFMITLQQTLDEFKQ